MAFYLIQAKLSPEAWKASMTNPRSRKESAAKLVKAVGGKLHHYFFAFGEDDIVMIVEAPDNVSVAAGALTALATRGLMASKTTVLMTTDEAVDAMKRASDIGERFALPGG